MPLTYEAASTRQYERGRTETIRSVTAKSEKFVSSLFDENIDDEERVLLLQDSCREHVKNTQSAIWLWNRQTFVRFENDFSREWYI